MDHDRILLHRIRFSAGVQQILREAYTDPIRAARTTVAEILVANPKSLNPTTKLETLNPIIPKSKP
jgi:hypothetical protein